MARLDKQTGMKIIEEIQETISRPLTVMYVCSADPEASAAGHVEVHSNVFSGSEVYALDKIAVRHHCSNLLHPYTLWRGAANKHQRVVAEIRAIP